METHADYHAALAALAWQVELGADEAIAEAPLNRYETPKKAEKPAPALPTQMPATPAKAAPPAPIKAPEVDGAAEAAFIAAEAPDLPALQAALADFPHCELRRGARNCVFADGNPAARVMVIGEAPGRDEDIQGRPFVGRAGQLLDRMFEAIGMGRAHEDLAQSLYITNVLPWRPPQNRDPQPDEIAMMLPFVQRHIALVEPELIVLMGNISCLAMLGRKGITRLRGEWQQVEGRPALPMFHPAYLLRNPAAKREAWADLLALQARMRAASG